MSDKTSNADSRAPSPEEIKEILGFIPLLAGYFRPARAMADMPDELRALFEDHRLTPRHGAVLTQMLAEEPLTVTALARRLDVSLGTASELVGDLSRTGWVDRREDPDNRRRAFVSIPEGRRPLVESMIAARAAPLLRVLEGLSPRDREGFRAGLRAWAREVREL
ncbi:transcriptional regulator [Nocardiopsis gilva YIM 90087]|uniref:Transcriptional regulator n=1 Tax=Nocardiopsis gilva YIM 90087 TaxID=1235441 RepID=A0A223RZX3_9ACTN|nr:MarR family transcriptional regulator [Nocardiopsis gilva]ASU81433.1 transcriptional regulator [Nocardiopsis gilva YIM 90087]